MSFVVELLNTTALYGYPAPPSQSFLQTSSMASRRTVTGKEAMASRGAAFLAARDRTHGKEATASHHAEFIAAGGHTVMWAGFEAAVAEWAVDLKVVKAAQEDQKRQKAVKKRESRCRKKEEAAHRDEESLVEIEARLDVAYKAGKENTDVWPARPYGSM